MKYRVLVTLTCEFTIDAINVDDAAEQAESLAVANSAPETITIDATTVETVQ